MAESRSDDSCEAPKDFQLSSIEGSESRFSATHRKCYLCFNFRKVFYCKQCIKNGDFVHSTSHFSERYPLCLLIKILITSFNSMIVNIDDRIFYI